MPILQRLIVSYKLWHEYIPNFTSTHRYTIGSEIDALFLKTTKLIFLAQYQAGQEKLKTAKEASSMFDLLKFLVQIFWEIGGINDKKYIALSNHFQEIGKMLGGWLRYLNKTKSAL